MCTSHRLVSMHVVMACVGGVLAVMPAVLVEAAACTLSRHLTFQICLHRHGLQLWRRSAPRAVESGRCRSAAPPFASHFVGKQPPQQCLYCMLSCVCGASQAVRAM